MLTCVAMFAETTLIFNEVRIYMKLSSSVDFCKAINIRRHHLIKPKKLKICMSALSTKLIAYKTK